MPLQNQLINWPTLYHLINHSPLTINPDSYLVDAIILMSQKQSQSLSLPSLNRYFNADICNQQKNSCVLIVEAGYLLGIITAKDVINIIASGVDITQTKVADVMVTALITLRQSHATDIFTAWSLLRHYQISYLPIVDNQGKLTGIITDSILVQAFNRDIIVGIKTACQKPKNNYRKINGISCSIHHNLQLGIEQKSSTFLSTHQELQETRKKLQMVEEKLHRTQDELEKLVAENQRLQQKIFKYQKAEAAWQNREKLYCQQKEESLRESEARLSLALEAAHMGIWDWKIQTDETLWSANMGLLYGLPNRTACPTKEDFLELVHPEDRQVFSQAVTATIQQGVKFVVEYRAVWPDSSIHWLNSTGQLYYNEDGQPSRLTGTTRDISDRKQAEQKILEQAALLDIVTDAIVVQDLQNRILFWNQGAEHLYGWSEQEAVDQNADELLFKQPSPKILAAIEKVIDSGIWQGELHKVTKSGKEIIVASRWTLMQDSTGKPKSILIVDTDITQKKQLEEQCFRTQRLESLGTLAGGIAHDLNNILTPILAASQLLQLKFPQDTERYYQLMAIIENNAKRGADLVKQVLSFARGFKGERTIILIKHLISEMLLIAKQTFPKSIEFAIAIPDNLLAVSGDVTQLHQVLMNLVVNARDAMPDGGKIEIFAENRLIDEAYAQMNLDAQAGHYIELTVADNGMGMPPEILDRIFEPFFTTKDIGIGTGLGLSTVLGIIKSHGGFINVSSKVGKGTKFKLFLPAVEGCPAIKTENLAVPLGEGELILVVDDEAKMLEIATIVLENYNYKILTASNGIEAIALYAQHKHQIKAVLMDMIMPEMDGITAIRTLQKMNPQVKIIACSGFNPQEKLTEVVNANIQLVLPKSFTAKDLLNSLQYVLRNQN
ncbi:PAS domain S-box protein [Nostoc cycadae]|uniref:histidine kinase n=1 Tax=Nostoc cycadae WK-1 TaxID=1861711 RepID=A0A2H6LP34_9NOSO|nr:PAS domain S-box protein [Nostoc cycadae]GBE94983.1 two-component sensor histidine kinase [Nostoc cycadae WK-1]